MKYRKKPVEIEAWQYKGNVYKDDTPEWIVNAYEKGILFHAGMFHELYINTLEGTHHVSDGDYIIKGVKDELYSCKPDIFDMTYEETEE